MDKRRSFVFRLFVCLLLGLFCQFLGLEAQYFNSASFGGVPSGFIQNVGFNGERESLSSIGGAKIGVYRRTQQRPSPIYYLPQPAYPQINYAPIRPFRPPVRPISYVQPIRPRPPVGPIPGKPFRPVVRPRPPPRKPYGKPGGIVKRSGGGLLGGLLGKGGGLLGGIVG